MGSTVAYSGEFPPSIKLTTPLEFGSAPMHLFLEFGESFPGTHDTVLRALRRAIYRSREAVSDTGQS